jgi:hypothetical protein
MASWLDLCYTEPTHFDWVLCMVDLWPIGVSLAMFTASAVTNSLYLWILWGATILDYALNLGLRYAFRDPSPNGALAHHAWEMPASSSQAMLCLGTMVVLFLLIYNVQQYTLYMIMLYILGSTALFSRLYRGINSPEQLMVGALVGCLEGIVYTIIWHMIGYPYTSKILRMWPLRAYGINDSLMAPRRMIEASPEDVVCCAVSLAMGNLNQKQVMALMRWCVEHEKRQQMVQQNRD